MSKPRQKKSLRQRSSSAATFGIGALVLALANPADAQENHRSREAASSHEFHLTDRAGLSGVRAADIDPARLRPGFRPVTDLHLRLSSTGGRIDDILTMADGQQPLRARGLFRAQLYAVVDGHLHTGATAWCGGWAADTARCEVDCEGGRFSLIRATPRSRKTGHMQLMIESGNVNSYSDPGGISLTACAYETGRELRLMPSAKRQNYAATFSRSAMN